MMLAVGNLRAKCEYEDKHKVSGKERVKEKWSSTLCGNPSVLLCDAYNCFSDMTHNFGSDLGKMTFVSRLLMTSFHDLITDSTLKLFSTHSVNCPDLRWFKAHAGDYVDDKGNPLDSNKTLLVFANNVDGGLKVKMVEKGSVFSRLATPGPNGKGVSSGPEDVKPGPSNTQTKGSGQGISKVSKSEKPQIRHGPHDECMRHVRQALKDFQESERNEVREMVSNLFLEMWEKSMRRTSGDYTDGDTADVDHTDDNVEFHNREEFNDDVGFTDDGQDCTPSSKRRRRTDDE